MDKKFLCEFQAFITAPDDEQAAGTFAQLLLSAEKINIVVVDTTNGERSTMSVNLDMVSEALIHAYDDFISDSLVAWEPRSRVVN